MAEMFKLTEKIVQKNLSPEGKIEHSREKTWLLVQSRGMKEGRGICCLVLQMTKSIPSLFSDDGTMDLSQEMLISHNSTILFWGYFLGLTPQCMWTSTRFGLHWETSSQDTAQWAGRRSTPLGLPFFGLCHGHTIPQSSSGEPFCCQGPFGYL